MKSVIKRTALREIRQSRGRFLAIFAIIALGVGFFAGVRITTPVMVNTVNEFLKKNNFFDYRLVSAIGWDRECVEEIRQQKDVRYAEGSISMDAMFQVAGKDEQIMRVHSVPENINRFQLKKGRMPKASDECVCDADFSGSVRLGDQITLSEANDGRTKESLRSQTLTVVGFADSSCYINFERGTTNIGNGSVSGFIYVSPEAFVSETFTEIFVRLDQDEPIYSDEYKSYMKGKEEKWKEITASCAASYGERLGLPVTPDVYLLDRESNIGYACFESDSRIVEQVARVFPVFFILVAALVCMTTMSRMVEERRNQIGILKALGYSNRTILGKFLFYSGTASILGCIVGYAIGIVLFPKVIWVSYELMYLSLPLEYVFDIRLAAMTLFVSVLCSMGTTLVVCRYELSETAASLMRPKAPKPGKRVLLEHIPVLWKRIPFLHKVSIRNIFRYKGRFLMMIMGISGCMALLLTGFGIKDSIADFAKIQYEQIQIADGSVNFHQAIEEGGEVPQILKEETQDYLLRYQRSWDLLAGDKVKAVDLIAVEDGTQISRYMLFHTKKGKEIPYPDVSTAIISESIANRYHIHPGDEITLRNQELKELKLRVSAVFENHVYNTIFIAKDTLVRQLNTPVSYQAAYFNFKPQADTYEKAATIGRAVEISNVTVFDSLKKRLSKMMSSLNYIVLIVIVCAAGLALIVIYNLTNINMTERSREIATIKVLGFFQNETSSYVLRENLFLTALGILAGLGLGVLLHRYVMAQIVVDMVSFKTAIFKQSFLYSIVLTFLFNLLVNLLMGRKLENINMAESLKSVE